MNEKEKELHRLMGELSSFPTYALVEELRQREGVDAKTANPYEDLTVTVNGPAILLTVID